MSGKLKPLPPPMDEEANPQVSTPPPKRPPNRQSRRKMIRGRFQAINTFIDAGQRHVSFCAAAVWTTLWRDERQGVTEASMRDLAARIGIDKYSVVRAIKQLERMGYLEIVRRGIGRVSTYRLHPLPKSQP